jgi:DNA-binding MarR family transcriptional regulator
MSSGEPDRAAPTSHHGAVPSFDLSAAPGHLIRRAQQRHTTLWRELVGDDVTSVQFAILVVLEADPRLDQRRLGERISLDTSSLAEVCERLTKRGLVARERDPADARRNLLKLTEEGEAALHRAVPHVEQVGRRLFDDLSASDRPDGAVTPRPRRA